MKSANQAIENVEYVRRLLKQKQPEFAASLNALRRWSKHSHENRRTMN